MKLLGSGVLKWPDQSSSSVTEIFFVPDQKVFFIATLQHQRRDMKSSLFAVRWGKQGGLHYEAEIAKGWHVRNMGQMKRPGAPSAFVFCDHGPDFPPFPGGAPILTVQTPLGFQTWQFEEFSGFHFDASISSNLPKGLTLLVLTDLQKSQRQIYSLDPQRPEKWNPLDHAWPDEVHSDGCLSCHFADFDNDGFDELIVGRRNKRERDVILKWDQNKFIIPDQQLPRKSHNPWETVQVSSDDLWGRGCLDIITLNHNLTIDRGEIEVYSNEGKLQFRRVPSGDRGTRLPDIENHWLHRAITLQQKSRPWKDILVQTRRNRHERSAQMPGFIYFKNLGPRLGFELVDLCLDSSWDTCAGFYVSDFLGKGEREILKIDYDGQWSLLSFPVGV